MAYILERVGIMLDCFPERADAPAALGQASALAAILAEYPDEIIQKITDPAKGMPVRQKWRPLPYELKQACEEEAAPIRRQAERESRMEESQRLLAAPDHPRPTLDEIKERLGPTYGINRAGDKPKPPVKTFDELLAYRSEKVAVSDELRAMLAAESPATLQERTG
jgi:hypothetical protein